MGKDRWGQFVWLCLCDCGKEHRATGGHLRAGEVKSCGCLKPTLLAAAFTKHGFATRGQKLPREYETWNRIIDRCENPNNPAYQYYGARGVRVCDRWRTDFAAFLADVGPRPSPKHSIDRIENNGHYEPGNVRWATGRQQAQNKRSNINITYRGETHCLKEWSRRLGAPYLRLYYRIVTRGLPPAQVFDEERPVAA